MISYSENHPIRTGTRLIWPTFLLLGKSSTLKDDCYPDWAPSQHLSQDSQVHLNRKTDVDGKIGADKRTQYFVEVTNEMKLVSTKNYCY